MHTVWKAGSIAAALAAALWLNGCAARDYSARGETDAAITQVRSDVRDLDERVGALDSNVQNLQTQLSGIEQQNAEVQASIKDQQDRVEARLRSLSATQRGEMEKLGGDMSASTTRDIEKLNAKLAEIIRVVQQENGNLQKKITADLVTLQKDVGALQAQIVASADRIDRLEQRGRTGSSSTSPAAGTATTGSSSGGSKPAGSGTTAGTATAVMRTGTPSSPDIDYSQGYEHTVVAGETLWKIARDYNVSVQDIINTNTNINDQSRLTPGKKIFVPYRKKKAAAGD